MSSNVKLSHHTETFVRFLKSKRELSVEEEHFLELYHQLEFLKNGPPPESVVVHMPLINKGGATKEMESVKRAERFCYQCSMIIAFLSFLGVLYIFAL